jgi:DNA-binding XRE family transcriptional regulator
MNKNKQSQIKTLLKKAGVKQKHIAAQINVTPQAVNQVVLGIRKNPIIRKSIAAAIGKPVEEVFPETKEAA